MKKLFINSIMALAMMGFIMACGGGGSSEYAEEEEAATDESTEAEEASAYSGETAWAVTHSVEDFEAWITAYEEVSDPAARGGIYRNVDDPNLISVFEMTQGHDAAKEWAMSDELKTGMEQAGVTSEPEFLYIDLRWNSGEDFTQEYRVLISHEVEDFDTWKALFDDDEDRRAEAGMYLTGMGTAADNPNMVFMMFATDDPSKMEEMMASDDLKARMEEAGVVSEPEATVWTLAKSYNSPSEEM